MQRPQLLDSLFERTATRFLRRIHRVTHRMPVKLRAVTKQRVLVVAPHPDDEAIAIGGTLALHQRAKSAVRTLFVTLEPPSDSGEIVRQGEAAKAAALLGFEHRFLAFPDGSASKHEPAIGRAIADEISAYQPEVIYCPFPGDHHRDHQAAAASTALAVKAARFRGEVHTYETWSNLWPNYGVDISTVVEQKRAAIDCYRSQVAWMSYSEASLGLNRFRGLKLGVRFAEALYVCGASDFVNVTRALAVV